MFFIEVTTVTRELYCQRGYRFDMPVYCHVEVSIGRLRRMFPCLQFQIPSIYNAMIEKVIEVL